MQQHLSVIGDRIEQAKLIAAEQPLKVDLDPRVLGQKPFMQLRDLREEHRIGHPPLLQQLPVPLPECGKDTQMRSELRIGIGLGQPLQRYLFPGQLLEKTEQPRAPSEERHQRSETKHPQLGKIGRLPHEQHPLQRIDHHPPPQRDTAHLELIHPHQIGDQPLSILPLKACMANGAGGRIDVKGFHGW